MGQSDYVVANIRIARYLAAYDDYERRKAETEAAQQRVIEAMRAMTEYDRQVFNQTVTEVTGEEALHAAPLD